jgi:glycosyltransferase involved in cell wall biosynthesis
VETLRELLNTEINPNDRMKVLVVANHNKNQFSPFIVEQADELRLLGVEIDYFGVVGKGILGYLRNKKELISKIKEFHPDIIHAHYGLSGLLANLQRKVPVVTTYHGSDINLNKVYWFSRISIFLSAFNIFVSEKNEKKANQKQKHALIPCGVDINIFKPMDKGKAREYFSFTKNDKLILFSGAFNNRLKNSQLAQDVVAKIQGVQLLELKGYSRQEVSLLMNAVDTVIMTSITEGSPQFIKEAMACNCPIVSVDVGDVKDVTANIDGCYISNYDPQEIEVNIKKAIALERTQGRSRIIELGLDSETVARKVIDVYNKVLAKK